MPHWAKTITERPLVTLAVGATAIILAMGIYLIDLSSPELLPPARPVPKNLVSLESERGQRLLYDSEARQAFLPLMSFYVTQRTQTYCGLASIVMVLNALGVPAPAPAEFKPYRLFTQTNVLGSPADNITSESRVSMEGMNPYLVAGVLRAYGLDASVHLAQNSSVDDFRTLASKYLGRPDHHVIVNYGRTALGQDGGGHISPLAAYDADTDRFLVLDVSRYKHPPFWVETVQLFKAMSEPIGDNSRSRGFVLIRD